MVESKDSHSRAAFAAMASNTGWMSLGELLMTRRISLVAVCCSRASARRLSRSRTPAPSFLGDLRMTGSLASTLAFAGFAPRRIGLLLLLRGVTTEQQSTIG